MVSRSSRGRPCNFREAIKLLARSAASTSKGAMRRSILSSIFSKSCIRMARRLPTGMLSSPKRISNTVTAVVQMDDRGCWSSQISTLSSGARSISSESTLVSRMIIPRRKEALSQSAILESGNQARVQRRSSQSQSRGRPQASYLPHARQRAEYRGPLLPCCGRYGGRGGAGAILHHFLYFEPRAAPCFGLPTHRYHDITSYDITLSFRYCL